MLLPSLTDYKFAYVDLGCAGCESYGGVFNKSSLCNLLQCGKLDLPEAEKNKNYTHCVFPYFIVADEAFLLKENIMRSYPVKSLTKSEIIFNFRLSIARRTIENSFGILVSRWRIFQGPIIAKVENVEKYIQAAVCLHNFFKNLEDNSNQAALYCPTHYIDQEVNDSCAYFIMMYQINMLLFK
jgi:hypothetical protein